MPRRRARHERGAAIIEALIVTATAGVIWAAAVRVLADLPPQAARWEEASAARQSVRAVEARLARAASRAAPIEAAIDGDLVRVPAVWPRRLGLFRPGAAGEVSPDAVTFLSRADPHRALRLDTALAASGGAVSATPEPGCGSAAACGLRAGDLVLAIARDGTCGLFRVTVVAAQVTMASIVEAGGAVFPPGSVLVPVTIDVIAFDAGDGALRRYDGYRSDSVIVDGVSDAAFAFPRHAAGELGDGPFTGAGPLGWDVDQLAPGPVSLRMTLGAPGVPAPASPGASLAWSPGAWP